MNNQENYKKAIDQIHASDELKEKAFENINYVKKPKKYYAVKTLLCWVAVTVLFCIGIGIGSFSINNSNERQKQELIEYITNLIQKIKNSENINNFELLILSIKENVGAILIIWFLGCTIIGGIFIYLAVIYKGFSIGYTISAMVAVLGMKQGIILSVISLFLQNIIFIPAFFLIAEKWNKII